MMEYSYIFNMVAFNQVAMEWMAVGIVRMTRENHNAYALGFRKSCKCDHQEFELEKSLLGMVIDWSDTEMQGLRDAVSTDMARTLLKGSQVHWNRSWQWVTNRIVSSKERTFEKSIFEKITCQTTTLKFGKHVCDSFRVLCS